ncbi:SusC/RagA family TonB-linked outer membrane protein [Flavivirga rizhaonensis]|uniref:SusC/RagA family TonB-linked outer membrane protein n=1 Tax=Flavivirga rizhaonensis TaxID=2559571 RepID=A0A4S1E111_9FLAO|nr:SusC/RagA family TonB-linked outer membrane protein [Flavivirga rizhaonensis]TGV04210.1 SusC/RagA family TonB-linked outer membrane protein [Flavivirga rizhaonensis]
MKKNSERGDFQSRRIRNILRIMKISIFLFFITVTSVFANDSYSQNKKLTLNMTNVKLGEVLDAIEENSKFYFLINKDLIDENRIVSINVTKAKISNILSLLLNDKEIEYVIHDKQIVFVKRGHRKLEDTSGLGLISNGFSTKIEASLINVKTTQNNTITGVVTDASGVPLAGANILEKGTTNGVVSDFDGKFSLNVSSGNVILVITYIGFSDKEVPAVAGQSNLNIILEENTAALDEVVVIGYGSTVRKKDLTGAVSSANLDNALETSNVSILQALQGSITGINIGAVTTAGANPSLSVRGRNTLHNNNVTSQNETNSNLPLIVLDGIIYRGSLVDINPSDIQSIDILKDASSAAIYGSQASNGVMVITTKSGGAASGKPIINYTSSYSIQSPTNKMRPMRSAEYEEFYPEIFWEEGARIGPDFLQRDPNFNFAQNLKTNFLIDGYNAGLDVDWWDQLTRQGTINMHNLSIRQRKENFNYFVSAGITDQKGFLVGDDYTRYNFRVNLESKINNWLKIGTQTYAIVSDYSGVNPSSRDVFRVQPWAPIRDDQGEFIVNPVDGLNPFLFKEQDNSDIRLNLSTTWYADINLPIKGLKYRLNYSNAYRTRNEFNFNPYEVNFTGEGFKEHIIGWDQTLDNIISFKRTFNNVHNLDVTLVYGIEKRHINETYSEASNFGLDILGFNRLQAGDPTLNIIETNKEEESSLYQMARVLYNYKNKYFLTGTIRRDGFSGFGANDKIAIFPTGAFAWAITEEDFANDISWLDFLKLRVSYGQSGRRGVDRLQTLARVSSEPSLVFGDGGSPSQGLSITTLSSPFLGWETTTGVNIGVDFEMLNSRLNGSIEYYNNKTENILFAIALPRIGGIPEVNSNIAEVANNGIELTLNGTIMKKKDFQWNASLNFNRVRNEITSIFGSSNDNDNDGQEDDLVGNGLFIGEPQNSIYNFDIIGMWQLSDRDNGTLPEGFFPGTYMLADLNDDGDISSLNDRKIIGYQDPSYRFGFANTITYKDFTLYAFLNSIQGGDNYYLGDDAFHSNRDQLSFTNVPSGGYDFWTPENPNARYRRLDTSSQLGAQEGNPNGAKPYSSRSFVRLQDVTLSYNIPNKVMSMLGLSRAKVFISGKNLVTWTKWKGWDPETGGGFGASANGVPTMKSYTLGLNVEF